MLTSLLQRRVWVNLFLGFSSGLPLSLCGATLQAWFTASGLPLMTIGLLTLVGQPYAYKFIWSPFMDRFVPPIFGRRRGWMFITQLLLLIVIACIAIFNPKDHNGIMAGLALLLAFVSASQDITIDAYRTDVLDEDQRGMGASLTIIGYRIALIVAGALALVMAQYWGWKFTYLIMSGLMLIGLFTTWFLAPEPTIDTPPGSIKAAIIKPFQEFFSRFGIRSAIFLLVVMILYKLGDAFTLSLNTTFLFRGLHFSLADIGLANKVVGLSFSVLGGFIAGIWMSRLSLFKALVFFGILQAVSNLTYMWLAYVGHNFDLMVFAIAVEQFCGGLGTTAFVALLMTLCNRKYTATQYALLSALTAMGRIYVGPAAAAMVGDIGWMWFYFWTFIIAWPGVIMLWFVRPYLKN